MILPNTWTLDDMTRFTEAFEKMYGRVQFHYAEKAETGRSGYAVRFFWYDDVKERKLIGCLGFKKEDLIKVGGKLGHYEWFFNDSEVNKYAQFTFQDYQKQQDLKRLSNPTLTIAEYRELVSKNAGDDLIFLAMTDANARYDMHKRKGFEKYRLKHKELCDWVSNDYLPTSPEISMAFSAAKRVYDAKSKIGIKEVYMDNSLKETVFAYRKETALTDFDWKSLKGKGLIRTCDYDDYAEIANLLNARLFINNPQTPDWHFGISYDEKKPNRLKLVLLEPAPESTPDNLQFKRLDLSNKQLNESEEHTYKNLKKSLQLAGFSADKNSYGHLKNVGYFSGDLSEFSLIVTKFDTAYKNIDNSIWTYFPCSNYVKSPTKMELHDKKAYRTLYKTYFALDKLFNKTRYY